MVKNEEMKAALVTLKDWIVAKDGNQYKAVYGQIIGTADGHIINSGGQNEIILPNESILTIQKCEAAPVKTTNIYFVE